MNQFNYKKTPENVPFISNRADPYVTRHDDGTYYFTASVPEYDRIILRKSDSLMGLREAPEKTVWKKHESGEMSAHIWRRSFTGSETPGISTLLRALQRMSGPSGRMCWSAGRRIPWKVPGRNWG